MIRSRDRGERLDPVRRRGPGRGTLLRLAVIAVLLATAAAVIRLRPAATACTTSVAPAISGATAPTGATASSGVTASRPSPPEVSGKPSIPEGTVGVPVRLADPTALALVHPGNLVDLLRLGDGGDSTPIASSALVLDVTGADDPTTGGLLLALAPEQADRAVGGSGHGFAILIRPG
ncbi:hypothetical protein Acy02nite_43070 [Actinoplanes cyaneus]|uniref:Flagellar biosynthesis protein FlgA n=1 Tax=Actinoplanes cyaneus TaxID=52696 RepID=A0A919MCS0_9ACTN|nr:hypothetical protein [Actinoplanes cyaneus]MCW2138463.1 hypothetical protein [Actinoplanes cyaneus]GID66426.1 hypothetical protein Acy02nite_43070 [Actinoplanes cyaneus]